MPAQAPPSPALGAPVVWALYAKRPGDNAQIETLAQAAGLLFIVQRLRFRKGLEALPNLRSGGSLFSLTAETQRSLQKGPPPALVIAAGKRSASAALWLKARHGPRLVHLGRTWAPGEWFDLIVTTPQYRQPAGPNVVLNSFPLTSPRRLSDQPAADLAALPRPRLLVAVGGDAAGIRFDAAAARAVARRAIERQEQDCGSLMVATSPRTSPEAAAALKASLPTGPGRIISIFGEDPNRYRDFLDAADAALVTGDSVSMVAEAAATGRRVEIFDLPRRPDLSARLRQGLALLGLEARAAALGLVDSGREIGAYMAGLQAEGWLDGDRAADRMAAELAATADRVRALAT